MIRTKYIKIKDLNFIEKIYIIEVLKGFVITFKHFFSNLFKMFTNKKIITIRYPEEKIPVLGVAKLKSNHRIKLRHDGTPKCVACMLCSTICPAKCIYIEAEEVESIIEKAPKIFNIDLSKCVMCGLCVEACPEDAISMDKGIFEGGSYNRFLNKSLGGLFYTKKELFLNLENEKISELGASNSLIFRREKYE
ncbi:MAG: NADH-quinone oxidoreductase subunit I [Candidatus Goldbacteria bacterium]|nr:NADH-quinone oxidoreductase subunit I [Candidatus Goldiibacteriota bacterium]